MVAEKISYVQRGTGHPVILIHGFGCSSAQWMYAVPALVEAGFRAIAVDLPGFGGSYLPGTPITTAGYAKVILEFMDDLGITEAVLVGSSMGGFVSWRVASLAPHRVTALVLSDAAGAPPQGVDAVAKKAARNANPLFRRVSGSLVSRPLVSLLLRPFTRLLATRFIRLSFEDRSRLTPEISNALRNAAEQARIVFTGRLRWTPLEEDAAHALSRVQCPALVVWGDSDRVIPIDSMRFFLDNLRKAEPVIFQGVGHVPMLEAPQDFNTAVLNFLRRIVRSNRQSR